jgi:hypothetical protein
MPDPLIPNKIFVGAVFVGQESVDDAVTWMPVGTRFTETDAHGSTNEFLVVRPGMININSGSGVYRYVSEEFSSIVITHVPVGLNATPDRVAAYLQSINWNNAETRMDRDRYWAQRAEDLLEFLRHEK